MYDVANPLFIAIAFNLFLFGDTHEGSILFYEHGFNGLVDIMTSSYRGVPASKNFGIHHGDSIEAITVDDRRFDINTIDKSQVPPLVQADVHIARLKPIHRKRRSFTKY